MEVVKEPSIEIALQADHGVRENYPGPLKKVRTERTQSPLRHQVHDGHEDRNQSVV